MLEPFTAYREGAGLMSQFKKHFFKKHHQYPSLTKQHFQAEVVLTSPLADVQAANWEKSLEQTQHPLACMDFMPRGKDNS